MFSTCGGDVRCVRLKWLEMTQLNVAIRTTNFNLAGFYKAHYGRQNQTGTRRHSCVSEKQPRRNDEERNKIHGAWNVICLVVRRNRQESRNYGIYCGLFFSKNRTDWLIRKTKTSGEMWEGETYGRSYSNYGTNSTSTNATSYFTSRSSTEPLHALTHTAHNLQQPDINTKK